ncbi:SRPBCC family protein, partial [Undibacterium sp.]|uniref:SRPBCC family protein n=1 Tax=Undibacterium sp. TaxID=1914977 RepID=UPI00374CBC84
MMTSTDRIEKEIQLKAPLPKVWKALSNAEEFGNWFGAALQGQSFVAGKSVKGNITIRGFEHIVFDALVVSIEPQHHFSFRWHPYPMDPAVDYAAEPTTLVVFELQESDTGTLLRVVESGFDQLPAARRSEAYRMNNGGWEG